MNYLTNPLDDIRPRADKRPTAGFPFGFTNEFQVSFTPIRAGIWNIFLFGNIEDATQFIPAIQVLQMAGENDAVVIHLSTNGGSLDATDTFLTAMDECEARILVKASGGVHSAGTVILLKADEFTLSENFNALVHNGFVGPGGKYSDWKVQAKHTEAYMEKVMRSTYAGFLSDSELDAMIGGKDFMFDADEFVDRWNARQELLKTQIKQNQESVMATLLALSEQVAEQAGDAEPTQKKPRKPRAKKPVEA